MTLAEARATLSAREQLADIHAPPTRCGSHAEERDGRVNRCVLDARHTELHTDGAMLWSDATAAWDCGDAHFLARPAERAEVPRSFRELRYAPTAPAPESPTERAPASRR